MDERWRRLGEYASCTLLHSGDRWEQSYSQQVVCMLTTESVAELPRPSAPLVAVDADFQTRWAAWVARGEVHDRRVRRRFVVSAAVLAIVAAIALAVFA